MQDWHMSLTLEWKKGRKVTTERGNETDITGWGNMNKYDRHKEGNLETEEGNKTQGCTQIHREGHRGQRHKGNPKIYPVTEHSISNRIALLINIRHFYDLKSNRHGAEYDAQAMLNLLYNLGYAVVYYQDLTAQEIDEALIRFSKHRKLFNTDSVFVVLMSHGDLGTIRGSDLKNFEIDKIYERLNTKNCPALMNKPKVIIIQACRGGDYHLCIITNTIKCSKSCFSLFVDTYSYRNPEYGSNFFHYICDVILTGCCQDDIEELFKKVSLRFEDFPSEQRQMPTKERDTLTKHFYLFPGTYHCWVCASTGPRIQTYSREDSKSTTQKVFTC
uniref:Caspase family p20 domain-containing protein n=1 Tax=Oreochromis aureus TaxID=47969 RepID=A0A668UQF3_OREAU